MSRYRQRREAATTALGNRPAACCRHDLDQHRGYPFADCIVPNCGCVVHFRDLRPRERREASR